MGVVDQDREAGEIAASGMAKLRPEAVNPERVGILAVEGWACHIQARAEKIVEGREPVVGRMDGCKPLVDCQQVAE